MAKRDRYFFELLSEDSRKEKLTPETSDPEEFFITLLQDCERKIPYAFDDLVDFTKEKARKLGMDREGLAESISRRNHEAADKSGGNFDIVLDLIRQRTEFERDIINDNLDRLDLPPLEKILFEIGLDLMPVIDTYFFRWKKAVPDVIKRTSLERGMERSDVAQMLIDRHLDDRYAVVTKERTGLPPRIYEENGDYRETSYGEFFSEENKEIVDILHDGIRSIEGHEGIDGDEGACWIAFFQEYANAVMNTDNNRHEELWRKVDEEWVKTSGRVIFVHPMEEGYADPIRIMPEVRVLFRLDEARDMIRMIKGRMLDWEEGLYRSHKLYPEFRTALENTHAGVYVTPLYSGEDYDFRFSGQIVPNRTDVRMKGTKIFMDSNSCRNNVAIYGKVAEKYMHGDFSKLYHDGVTPETFLYYVIAHECGHSVLMGAETKEGMGDNYRNLEEFKASHIGLEVLRTMEERLPPGFLDSLSLFIVTRIVRFLTKGMRSDRTLEPYFREALIQLGVLLDRNFLFLHEGRLDFQMKDRKPFFEAILHINRELKQIYLDENWAMAREFRLRHTGIDERTENLFRYLDDMDGAG